MFKKPINKQVITILLNNYQELGVRMKNYQQKHSPEHHGLIFTVSQTLEPVNSKICKFKRTKAAVTDEAGNISNPNKPP